jgi:hypothetical protein
VGGSYQFTGGAAVDLSGWSVSSAGDVDGDGLDDLIIGAPNADGAGTNSGESYLILAADLAALDAEDGTTDGEINLALVAGPVSLEGITVNVDDTGAGTIIKSAGVTDSVASVENFVALETPGQIDEITITDSGNGFVLSDIVGIDTGAEDGQTAGTFTPVDTGTPIAFGPSEALSYDDIVANIQSGTYPGGGTFQITSGDETGSVGGIGFENFETINFGVLCFARGTLIKTIRGEVAVEDLEVGYRVLTMDRGYRPLRWIGRRWLCEAELETNPKLRPIRIRAGALGEGQPEIDLVVSPQHRVLLRSRIAERMFGHSEVLVPANKLLPIDGIDVGGDTCGVEYFHLLFDEHQIVFSNGAPTESLFTGREALQTLAPEAREEIETLFPEMTKADFKPISARFIPEKGKLMKALVARHRKNRQPLLIGESLLGLAGGVSGLRRSA